MILETEIVFTLLLTCKTTIQANHGKKQIVMYQYHNDKLDNNMNEN